MGPLAAEFLVAEDRGESELLEDDAESGAIVDGGLGLNADLVAGRAVVGGIYLALVGDGPDRAVLADAEDLFEIAETAGGGVIEGVLLEGARRHKLEAESGEAGLEKLEVVDGKFEFDLGILHEKSIKAAAVGWGGGGTVEDSSYGRE